MVKFLAKNRFKHAGSVGRLFLWVENSAGFWRVFSSCQLRSCTVRLRPSRQHFRLEMFFFSHLETWRGFGCSEKFPSISELWKWIPKMFRFSDGKPVHWIMGNRAEFGSGWSCSSCGIFWNFRRKQTVEMAVCCFRLSSLSIESYYTVLDWEFKAPCIHHIIVIQRRAIEYPSDIPQWTSYGFAKDQTHSTMKWSIWRENLRSFCSNNVKN